VAQLPRTKTQMSSSTSQPTTRSRTLLFISYRDSRARSSRFSRTNPPSSYDDPDIGANENERLMSSQPGHVSLDVDLPPKWYPLCGYILYHALLLSRRVDVSDHVQDILGGTHAKSESLQCRHVRSTLKLFVHFLQLRR
jgi:syntaxin 16